MNHYPNVCVYDILIQKQRQVIKKLEEIKVKTEDLKTAKKELAVLLRELDLEILRSGVTLDESSDSD